MFNPTPSQTLARTNTLTSQFTAINRTDRRPFEISTMNMYVWHDRHFRAYILALSWWFSANDTKPFLFGKNGAGPTVVRCCSTNKIHTISTAQFFMLSLRWPYVARPTQLNVSFSNFHLVHDDVGLTLALCCAPNADFQPTVQQFANVGPM